MNVMTTTMMPSGLGSPASQMPLHQSLIVTGPQCSERQSGRKAKSQRDNINKRFPIYNALCGAGEDSPPWLSCPGGGKTTTPERTTGPRAAPLPWNCWVSISLFHLKSSRGPPLSLGGS